MIKGFNEQEKSELKVFALGGLNEVGKNMYCLEYKDELLIIDSGILFPDDDQFGIDYIIPDYTYLLENQHKIKGLFITHGHEDHIGGIPYLLKQVKIPKIYANGLTLALIKKKLEDYPDIKANMYEFDELEKINFKNLTVSFFRVNHSIPDSFAIVIETPYGEVVSTGDFKIDLTPEGKDANYQKICSLGKNGILLLMSDSTNSKLKDLSTSERVVTENIADLFREVKGRILIATFASNVYRINQIVESSISTGRKVCVIGRSMENIIQIGSDLGYINASSLNFIEPKDLPNYKDEEITIICTGTQGEPMAALTRIAQGVHKQIVVKEGDTVIFSSSAIPGNSTGIDYVINLLSKAGANVIVRSAFNDVHASGHAGSSEQKIILKLLRPKYFLPVHGEYYMLRMHAKSAVDSGMDPRNVFILDNGKVLSIDDKKARILSTKIKSDPIMIDGMDIGGVNTAVINERKELKLNGMVTAIVTLNQHYRVTVKPTVISKGFLYAHDNEHVFELIDEFIIKYFESSTKTDIQEIKKDFEPKLREFIKQITRQTPMVFSIINLAQI